jgi:hypothetical protein
MLARTGSNASGDIVSLDMSKVGGLSEVPDSCDSIEAGRGHLVVVIAAEKAASRYFGTSTRKTPQQTRTISVPEEALPIVSRATENGLSRMTIHG